MPVATALTVYGIETFWRLVSIGRPPRKVATALTVYGIETHFNMFIANTCFTVVATALTVYGIETLILATRVKACLCGSCNSTYRLRY